MTSRELQLAAENEMIEMLLERLDSLVTCPDVSSRVLLLAAVRRMPAFPCGWDEPRIIRGRGVACIEWHGMLMDPEELLGIVRALVEKAVEAER